MNNQFITTTELREQSSKLVASLMAGENLSLVYRSKIIGLIRPMTAKSKVIENLTEFRKAVLSLQPAKPISYDKRRQLYRDYLKKRHGQNLP
ncbi:hypothetical protein MUP32_02565 [Candidatus Microgenomates bacterium]|nr:hypothetical protein [Candidatus Microgenomates bacterium]